MSRTTVVLSGLVDATIQEYQKDVHYYIFKTLEELDEYITTTPIRADDLFFTRDVIPQTNTSLDYLISMLGRVFFKVDHVIYITEPESPELVSIEFAQTELGMDNWEVITGALNREYVTSVINGSARNDFTNTKRKAVYRVPKESYVRERSKQSEMMAEQEYLDDDRSMPEMPDVRVPEYIPPDREKTCQCYDIVGDNIAERTVFSFVMAQYLATRGKTLIMERDWEFHTLGECVTKSGVQCSILYIDDIMTNALDTIEKIKYSKEKLVVLLCKRKFEYNYSYVFNLLYSRLIDSMDYCVREDVFGEEPTEGKYTVVFPNTMVGLLKMCKQVNMNFLKYTKFVGIHTNTFEALRLPTGDVIKTIIEDVLNSHEISDVQLVSLTSLVMGVDITYDLRSVLWI